MFKIILLDGWGDIESTASHINATIDHLCYILCGVFALVGSLRIYNKWQLGGRHHFHIDAEIAGWFGASLFFLAARSVIDHVF